MAFDFSYCHYLLQKQMYTKGDQKKKLWKNIHIFQDKKYNEKLQNEVYDFDTKTVGTHSFGAEDPLEINFVYDETNYSFNYTVSQSTLTQDLGVKVFSPLIYQNDAGPMPVEDGFTYGSY